VISIPNIHQSTIPINPKDWSLIPTPKPQLVATPKKSKKNNSVSTNFPLNIQGKLPFMVEQLTHVLPFVQVVVVHFHTDVEGHLQVVVPSSMNRERHVGLDQSRIKTRQSARESTTYVAGFDGDSMHVHVLE